MSDAPTVPRRADEQDAWAGGDGALPPSRGTRVVVAVAVLLVVALVGFLLGRAGGDRPPTEGSADVGFARDMQVHHAQAVELALVVRDETSDAAIRGLAYDIATSQAQQQGQMFGWLSAWGLPQTGSQRPMAWMVGSGHRHSQPGVDPRTHLLPHDRMPGMATDAEVAHLRALRDRPAEVEFLRLMIVHHEGGIPMAQAAVDLARRPEVVTLARAMARAQTNELAVMRTMLRERGVAPPG